MGEHDLGNGGTPGGVEDEGAEGVERAARGVKQAREQASNPSPTASTPNHRNPRLLHM